MDFFFDFQSICNEIHIIMEEISSLKAQWISNHPAISRLKFWNSLPRLDLNHLLQGSWQKHLNYNQCLEYLWYYIDDVSFQFKSCCVLLLFCCGLIRKY